MDRMYRGLGAVLLLTTVLGLTVPLTGWAQDEKKGKDAAEAEEVAKPEGDADAGKAEATGEKKAPDGEAAEAVEGEGGEEAKAAAGDKAGEEAAAKPEKPKEAPPPPEVDRPTPVGEFMIVDRVRGTPADRKKWRAPELWQHYMHGVVDHHAKPVDMGSLLGAEQAPEAWLDGNAPLQAGYKQSSMPAIKLEGKKEIAFEKRIPVNLRELGGRYVRVFVWMKAEGVGLPNSCWDGAPGMELVIRDDDVVVLAPEAGGDEGEKKDKEGGEGETGDAPPAKTPIMSRAVSLMKTQGSFPWHCYYRDIWVPGEPWVEPEPEEDVEEKAEDGDKAEDGEGGKEGEEAKDGAEDGKKKDKGDDEGEGGEESEEAKEKGETGTDDGKAAEKKDEKKEDAPIPPGGPSLYVRFFNPAGGTVWFSTLSWESVCRENTYTLEERQDPVTGSVAPNPKYDELPFHLRSGKAIEYKWNFLKGKAAGLVGQPFDLTRTAQLAEYYKTVAKKDPTHFFAFTSGMAGWYHTGMKFGTLPEVEDGWLKALDVLIQEDQNQQTGLWGYERAPDSLAATVHVLEGLFGECPVERADREEAKKTWLSAGADRIPRASRILSTVLDMQATSEAGDGKVQLAGWPINTYDYDRPLVGKEKHKCSLAATANAMALLRMTAPQGRRDASIRTYRAIRYAFRYVLENCTTPEGLWKQNDIDADVTHGGFMLRLLEYSSYLERRVVPELADPQVALTANEEGVCELVWKEPSQECVSLRVFVVPKETPPELVTEKNLVGIALRTTGETLVEQDPILAVRKMKKASIAKWNLRWSLGLDSYIVWKLAMIPEILALQLNGAPLAFTIPELDKKTVYVSVANWYGEQSMPLQVDVSEPAEEPAEDEAKDGDKKKDGKKGK